MFFFVFFFNIIWWVIGVCLENKAPKIVNSSASTQILVQGKQWLFKTTFSFLSLRKSYKILIISLQTLFCLGLKIRLSCHALPMGLEISMNILGTSSLILKALKISWLTDRSWLMKEPLCLNLDWFEESSLS